MGNAFGGGKKAPAPNRTAIKKPDQAAVDSAVASAQTASQNIASLGGMRRRGGMGRMNTLLSSGYRGFGTEENLG